MPSNKKLRVTLIKSKFGRRPVHQQCIAGLGLSRMHQIVEIEDNPCNRGMIKKAAYMLNVEEVG